MSNYKDAQAQSIKISLAEWFLHKSLQSHTISNLDFPVIARNVYHLEAIEYVSLFFENQAEDILYLSKLKANCKKNKITSVLIMVDGEGMLGDTNVMDR
jgi:hypothetical protein